VGSVALDAEQHAAEKPGDAERRDHERGADRASLTPPSEESENDRSARRTEGHADAISCVLCLTVCETSP
jgi:hypothetical protein